MGRVVGHSLPRKEDMPLLRGSGTFVDDLNHPGALQVAILRSPHAHARIAGIDVAAARSRPGVVDLLTAADLPGRVRIPMRMFKNPGMERYLQSPLADGVVRYSGDPIAAVVAESRYAAEDALDAIEVDFEPLEPVLELERAVEEGSTLLHEGTETNVASRIALSIGDTDAAFDQADLVLEERMYCQRHAAVPLEPRGLVAAVDPESGRLTVWGAAKIIHVNHGILARLLDWPKERIRLVEVHVGGGFGARGEFYPEDFIVPYCAIRTGRPVAWTADRDEELRGLNHSRDQLHHVGLAVREDGSLLALRDHFLLDTGGYVRTHGAVVPNMAIALLPGPYAWDAYDLEVRQVVTNKTPAGTYRAPGRFESNFVRERMIDIAAHRLDRDPVELRRQNLIAPDAMPYEVGTETDGHPVVFDSGDYPLLLDKGIELFDYDEMRRWREADPGPGKRRGIGLGFFVEKAGIGQFEFARVGVDPDGATVVQVGAASIGQGMETVLAQICAETLGVSYDDVQVVYGDTDVDPEGMGAFGSRVTSLGGPAVMEASGALRERLLSAAAEQLEASADDLAIVGDRVAVRGSPAAGMPLAELARSMGAGSEGPGGLGLAEEHRFECEDMNFPYGLHLVAVEVDTDTGAVDVHRYAVAYDVGLAINPQLVEAQVVGGAAQGIGGALLEELSYDAQGQLVSGSFMDYLIPTASEVPDLDVLVTEDAPTPLTPLGAKGAGEGGTAATGAAIANAVSDALGIEATRLPLTPEWVAGAAQAPATP